MTNHTAKTVNFDYRERALEFSVDAIVAPLGDPHTTGRVTDVWPAIGMVDVEWPNGNGRCAVEDLMLLDSSKVMSIPPKTDNSTRMVHPGGMATRVAQAWIKKSIYWAARDRKYRASQTEIESGVYNCPKCKEDTLRRSSYKRLEGKSVKLLVCPSCLFSIRIKDLKGCHWNSDCDDEVTDGLL